MATFEHDDERCARQLVHFWEATATFIASFLLAALRSSESLWNEQVPELRAALRNGECSFERASLGTWRITIERLSKVFRTGLFGEDPDERERIHRILGGPPLDLARRILSPEIVNLLSRVNQSRNTLDGHAATMTKAQAKSARTEFQSLTEQLRDLLGYGWVDFPLVRAGHLDFGDEGYTVQAEILVGPTTPFKVKTIPCSEALKRHRMYLVGETSVVALAPFVQLGTALNDEETTCYFYNRTEAEGVRMVAYHLTDHNEIRKQDDQVSLMLREIETAERPEPLPDLGQLQ